MRLRGEILGLFLLLGLQPATAVLSQRPSPLEAGVLDPVAAKTDLYPADADAKKEIAAALKLAATDHKRVLLVFGANWCYDCHVLDRALHEGAAGQVVKESFLLVHVDVGEADKNLGLAKQYKIPLDKGVPAVAILGSDGKLLYSSGDGEFEAARRMMKKDLVAFLIRWRESPLQNRERTGGGCDRVLGST
jgi:thiol:disulfide interchange protein